MQEIRTQARADAGPSTLRVGDAVRVRSEEDILATLDENGRHGGLPFMPEMRAFAGRELTVVKVAHKTCDVINKDRTLRKLDRTVHLTGVRCDGSAHGGCEAGCLLFWRDDWLERADGTPLGDQAAGPPRATASTLDADTVAGTDQDGAPLYRCQATELVRASSLQPKAEVGQYVTDVRSGNFRLRTVLFGLLVTLFNKFQDVTRALPRALRIRGGEYYPFYAGTGPTPAPPALNLEPGELVEVRSKDEIMATLGGNRRMRGLWFDQEMLIFCGRRARVLTRVNKIIDEATGRMRDLRDCVVLKDMTCVGRFHGFCPRSDHTYWREAWLRRVQD